MANGQQYPKLLTKLGCSIWRSRREVYGDVSGWLDGGHIQECEDAHELTGAYNLTGKSQSRNPTSVANSRPTTHFDLRDRQAWEVEVPWKAPNVWSAEKCEVFGWLN